MRHDLTHQVIIVKIIQEKATNPFRVVDLLILIFEGKAASLTAVSPDSLKIPL